MADGDMKDFFKRPKAIEEGNKFCYLISVILD